MEDYNAGSAMLLSIISFFATYWLFWLLIYFLPYIISFKRNHRNRTSIFILNLFLGWTFIGWVASLVWAFTNDIQNRNIDSVIKKPQKNFTLRKIYDKDSIVIASIIITILIIIAIIANINLK